MLNPKHKFGFIGRERPETYVPLECRMRDYRERERKRERERLRDVNAKIQVWSIEKKKSSERSTESLHVASREVMRTGCGRKD